MPARLHSELPSSVHRWRCGMAVDNLLHLHVAIVCTKYPDWRPCHTGFKIMLLFFHLDIRLGEWLSQTKYIKRR